MIPDFPTKVEYVSKDSLPIVVHTWSRNFIIMSITYEIEDRRPDLKEYPSKYKHFLEVRILFTRYRWCFHTRMDYNHLPYKC